MNHILVEKEEEVSRENVVEEQIKSQFLEFMKRQQGLYRNRP
jgi:hypothetical protein